MRGGSVKSQIGKLDKSFFFKKRLEKKFCSEIFQHYETKPCVF